MAVGDKSKVLDIAAKTSVIAATIALAVVGVTRGLSAQGADGPRPAISQRAGNTWCGVVSTAGGSNLMEFSKELATYVDGGATIEGYVKDAKADHTALVCGPVGRPER